MVAYDCSLFRWIFQSDNWPHDCVSVKLSTAAVRMENVPVARQVSDMMLSL